MSISAKRVLIGGLGGMLIAIFVAPLIGFWPSLALAFAWGWFIPSLIGNEQDEVKDE